MSPYELLGVRPEVTELDVRRAHRELVRLLHPADQPGPHGLPDQHGQPDQHGVRAERHLQVVNEARDKVIADIRRRERLAPATTTTQTTQTTQTASVDAVGPEVPRPVVPLQRSSSTELSTVPSADLSTDLGAGRRWAEHQEWLRHQQQHGEDRQARGENPAQREERVAERQRQRRRALFLAPFLLVVTGDVALALGKLLGTGLLS